MRCDWGINPPHGYAGGHPACPPRTAFPHGTPRTSGQEALTGLTDARRCPVALSVGDVIPGIPLPSHYLCLSSSSIPVSESFCLSLPPSPTLLILNCSSAPYSPTHLSTPHSQPRQCPPPPQDFSQLSSVPLKHLLQLSGDTETVLVSCMGSWALSSPTEVKCLSLPDRDPLQEEANAGPGHFLLEGPAMLPAPDTTGPHDSSVTRRERMAVLRAPGGNHRSLGSVSSSVTEITIPT